MGKEIFDWILFRTLTPGAELKLSKDGKLIGNEFKGDIGLFGNIDLFLSNGKSAPRKVLHHVAKFIEDAPPLEREKRLKQVNLLFKVFQEILTKDSPIVTRDGESVKLPNQEQINKYYRLSQGIFKGFMAQTNLNSALNELTIATQTIATEAIDDFVQGKLQDLNITNSEDKKEIAQALKYAMGTSNRNTDPPIKARDFEFFEGSSLYGTHLKGNMQQCLQCALTVNAIALCYQRGYKALQDPLVSWVLQKFEFQSQNEEGIEFTSSDNTTVIRADLGNLGKRFESYLKTGDFFEAFLRPSDTQYTAKSIGKTVNLLNDTKIIFEQSYNSPPTRDWAKEHSVTETNKLNSDPVAKNWIDYHNTWAKKYQDRATEIKAKANREYQLFIRQGRAEISANELYQNFLQEDPYLDKLKLHYAMETTLRGMVKEAIDTIINNLKLTEDDINQMPEPLKSKALETRDALIAKKLEIFKTTIPRLLRERLEHTLNDPENKDLPLFEYAIENLKEKTVEDGFAIINDIMQDQNIQSLVHKISEYKYEQILDQYNLEKDSNTAKQLELLIIGNKSNPSLISSGFIEIRDFFHDIQAQAKQRNVSLLDDEMRVIFDNNLIKLNDNLLRYTLTGKNKELFKELVFDLYKKHFTKILSNIPNIDENTEIARIQANIDQIIQQKINIIIDRLKLKSSGQSPIKVIENLEENLIEILDKDIFGNKDLKSLLTELTQEIFAEQISQYAKHFFSPEIAAKILHRIENQKEGESKIDAANSALRSALYQNYKENGEKMAKLLLTLKKQLETSVDEFFKEGNQKSIELLIVDLKSNLSKELGKFFIGNEDLLFSAFNEQLDNVGTDILRIAGTKTTDDTDLRSDIDAFKGYLKAQIESSIPKIILSSGIEELNNTDNVSVHDYLDYIKDFTNEIFWSKDESKEHIIKIVNSFLDSQINRITKLINQTYSDFDEEKKQRMTKQLKALIENHRPAALRLIDEMFKTGKKGDYNQMLKDILSTTTLKINENLEQDSDFYYFLRSLTLDTIKSNVHKITSASLLPDSTKNKIKELESILLGDIKTLFDQKNGITGFQSIGDFLTYIEDTIHFGLNNILVNESKAYDVAELFVTGIYSEAGMLQFQAQLQSQDEPLGHTWKDERFIRPHASNIVRASQKVFESLRLQNIVRKEGEKIEIEELSKYINRIKTNNYSLISPLISEFAQIIRFQVLCQQFQRKLEECLSNEDLEKSDTIFLPHIVQSILFLRKTTNSKLEGCQENISQVLSEKNLMEVAKKASKRNTEQKKYWDYKNWLAIVIEENSNLEPNIIECSVNEFMADLGQLLKQKKSTIEDYSGADVHLIIEDIVSPKFLQEIKKDNPQIFSQIHSRIIDYFSNPDSTNNKNLSIREVLSKHITDELIPAIVHSPSFQKKSILLLTNANTNSVIEGVANAKNINPKLLSILAVGLGIKREWITILQGDTKVSLSAEEVDDIFKFAPECTKRFATKALTPIELNMRSSLSSLLVKSNKLKENPLCFQSGNSQTHCISLTQENLEQLDETQSLELLIQRATRLLETLSTKYKTMEEIEIINDQGEVEVECQPKFHLIGENSFIALEQEALDELMLTLKAFIEETLVLKFLLQGVKESLPALRSSNRDEAAKIMMKHFEDNSTKGGLLGGGGIFRKLLSKEKLQDLEQDYLNFSKCLTQQ